MEGCLFGAIYAACTDIPREGLTALQSRLSSFFQTADLRSEEEDHLPVKLVPILQDKLPDEILCLDPRDSK